MLGWIVESINMTIALPSHRMARLKKIVSSIPSTQHRVGVDKWHQVLGKLRSMALALPGARGLFSQMQEALCHVKDKRVTLSTGVHEPWKTSNGWLRTWLSGLHECMSLSRSAQPRTATTTPQDTCAGAWCSWDQPTYLGKFRQPRAARPSPNPTGEHPIVWRMPFPKDTVGYLVSWTNPQGTVNNSEL